MGEGGMGNVSKQGNANSVVCLCVCAPPPPIPQHAHYLYWDGLHRSPQLLASVKRSVNQADRTDNNSEGTVTIGWALSKQADHSRRVTHRASIPYKL